MILVGLLSALWLHALWDLRSPIIGPKSHSAESYCYRCPQGRVWIALCVHPHMQPMLPPLVVSCAATADGYCCCCRCPQGSVWVALCTRTRHPCYARRGITCTECRRLLLLLLLLGGAVSRMLLLLLLSQGSVWVALCTHTCFTLSAPCVFSTCNGAEAM